MAVTGVIDLVTEWVRRQPDACAVRDPMTGESLSYQELWERAGWVAGMLVGCGIGPSNLVAVDLPRSVDLVVAFLGVVRAGAAYIPLDVKAPTGRINAILEESGARVLICAPGAEKRRWTRPEPGVRVVPVPRTRPDAVVVPRPAAETAAGEDPVYVTYTSGSTGRPKGVVIPHRAVHRLVVPPTNYCTIEPGDRVANTCNPAFDVTTCEIWSTLTLGGTIVPFPLVTDVSLDDWVALVRNEGIVTMFLATSWFHTVAWERPDAFGSLRDLVVGGEQLDLSAVNRVLAAGPPRRLVNGYGPTEATAFATFFECTADSLAGLDRVPIGHPLQKTTAYVLDDDLRPVASGQTGELCLGGPGVALGYLNRPELTEERFVTRPESGERVYRTGDLVRELPSGALEMLGRKDRQIKLRGFRIELEEIERFAVATGLVDAAFVEKVREGTAASLVGFLLPTQPRTEDDLPAALTAKLAERLPDYMIPSRWLVLDTFPIGGNGKADRKQMLALLDDDRGDARHRDAATDDTDDPILHAVRGIWQELLGVTDLLGTDNFIDRGGNSILAVQVASRIQQRLVVRLEPADILLADSLTDLATQVRGTAQPIAVAVRIRCHRDPGRTVE